MNVVMIIADTVRADYLGVNGGPVHTPNLDALARSSVHFRNAFANSFPTVPARADYLTGGYAFAGVGWNPLPRNTQTVPALLSASGVVTVGVVDTPFYVAHGYHYDRGFRYFYEHRTQDIFDELPVVYDLASREREAERQCPSDAVRARKASRERLVQSQMDPRLPNRGGLLGDARLSEYDYCAPRTITTAEKALEKLGEDPFFLYVDTWDPHEPWDPPTYYTRKYKPDYDGRLVYPPYGRYTDFGLTDEDFEVARACYCGELEMVDRWIGRLLERIDSLGIADQTAVFFVSDHGYYFGEHGGMLGKMVRYGTSSQWLRSPLYPECTNVPLMIRVPGIEPRTEDALVASAINMAPTLLDLFGLEAPEHMRGRSLLPLVQSATAGGDDFVLTAMPLATPGDPIRVVDDITRFVGEWQPITVITPEWLMLFSRWEEPIELYATNGSLYDAVAGGNLAERRPDVVQELHAKMISELRRAGASEEAIAARE